MTTIYVADTGVFVRCGGPDNDKFQHLRRAVRQADVSLRIPNRVYEELGVTRQPTNIHRGISRIQRASKRDGSSSPRIWTTQTRSFRR